MVMTEQNPNYQFHSLDFSPQQLARSPAPLACFGKSSRGRCFWEGPLRRPCTELEGRGAQMVQSAWWGGAVRDRGFES
ncbi:hypothetical protein MATL_G00071060 [Megalops atlanticus]|uniref:Uncharacterized protein n=1 Tax=Megalops atlanticus TaxID=7932 RepID=A0A9D3Q5B1_MEGAT|nr:hypothetical protein MATL_G00071060 [Megalops atlanticus]